MNDTLVVAGLGNPGGGYARTKHNLGAELVEALASDAGVELKRRRGQLRTTPATIEGRDALLVVPTVFMNESGRPIARIVRKHRVPPEQLLVVHDELDLEPGIVRLKSGGGTAGHNGLRSIEASLRSRDFLRLRIGVGKPPSKFEGADHVLSRFTPEDRDLVDTAMDRARRAVHVFAADGLDAAQNWLHLS